MKADERTAPITRDSIMTLLADDEVARVSAADTEVTLADGDEYVDLRTPDKGVRRALGAGLERMANVLPRRAVHEHTWDRILELIYAHLASAAKRDNTR